MLKCICGFFFFMILCGSFEFFILGSKNFVLNVYCDIV